MGNDMAFADRGYGWFTLHYNYNDHKDINATLLHYTWIRFYNLIDKVNYILTHIDQAVANGLRARVALAMEDWVNAESHAYQAITIAESFGKKLYQPWEYTAEAFNSVNASEWLWGSEISVEDATDYASFYSHMDARFMSYAHLGGQKLITHDLYNSFPNTDIRKSLFIAPGEGEHPLVDYNQMKFLTPVTGSFAGDYLYMRLSEMYLVHAEALAQQGTKDSEAQQSLYNLISLRDTTYNQTNNTGQELLYEILLNRRMELWGEGHSYLDIRRLQLPLQRPYNDNHIEGLAIIMELPPNDDMFLWQYPFHVMIGDINDDGIVNVLDVVMLINYIIGNDPDGFNKEAADINSDGNIDIADVVSLVNLILGIDSKTSDLYSEAANIDIQKGTIILKSDGTLAGLQFEMEVDDPGNVAIDLLVDGFQLAYTVDGNLVKGIMYNLNNKPLPPGEIDILKTNIDKESMLWGTVKAANTIGNGVDVIPKTATSSYNNFNSNIQMNVYPNPSPGLINVEISAMKEINIEIDLYDISGRKLTGMYKNLSYTGNHIVTFNENNTMSPGLYLLNVKVYDKDHKLLQFKKDVKVLIK